jgi:hypothetical protein
MISKTLLKAKGKISLGKAFI